MACVVCFPGRCSENCVLRSVFSGVGTEEEVNLRKYHSQKILSRLKESHVRYELEKADSQESKTALVESWVREFDAYKAYPIFGPNKMLADMELRESIVENEWDAFKLRESIVENELDALRRGYSTSDSPPPSVEMNPWEFFNFDQINLNGDGSDTSGWGSDSNTFSFGASNAGGSHSRSSSVGSVDECFALRASKDGLENLNKWKERQLQLSDGANSGDGGGHRHSGRRHRTKGKRKSMEIMETIP